VTEEIKQADSLTVRPTRVGLRVDIQLEYSDIFDWWRAGCLIEGQAFIGGGYKNPMFALANLFKGLSDVHNDQKLSLVLERFIHRGAAI
jgi:hypothetical protein